MPGLLIMNSNGADARDGESRKRTHDGKLVNGERTPRKDTPTTNGLSNMNGAVTSVAEPAILDQFHELPPEILHLSSEFYHPLSKLVQRISQECFNDLNDTLRTMSEILVNQYPNGVLTNGLGGHAASFSDSPANKQKKLLLMKFAQENRAKFIKLLVLTEWGKKTSVDISRVIDLSQWTRDQIVAQDSADVKMFEIKDLIYHARQPNPDIRTSLEVLSKGKAEWLPHMHYIPPEPISPEKALKLLRYLSTSLAIRLNVHENLPRHLKKWHVANGRATFVVDSEFELDVLTYSEDASEQWFFIDLRLLFSPAPTIALGTRFQRFFQPRLDEILRQSGLSGCFDFLHNFILTHKINVLKSQAHQLSQTSWFGSIKIEPVHRSLVVQYWTDRPGKKSWIEIGISSCKPKNGKVSWRGPPVSALVVRWFRHGVEVKDVDLKFDFKNLSMERMLKRVLSLHVGHFLRTTQGSIPPRIPTKMSLSESEPCDCTLAVSLGRPENKIIVSLEAVTGRFILRPCLSISARAEQAINQSKDPLANIGTTISQLLAQTLLDVVQRHAQQLGWRPTARHSLKMDTVKQATKADVLQYALYWPSGWTSKWALAVIIDSAGESWWFMELNTRATSIEYAEELRMEKAGPRPPISRATLASIERLAVQQLAFFVTRRELQRLNIPSSTRTELAVSSSSVSATALRGWVLHLRTADLLVTKSGEEPWLDPYLRVTSQGIKADYKNVSHIASGTMVKSVAADMQKLMSASPQSNFTFSENGSFAILLTTPFGEPIVDELKARLRDVDRLRSFTTILQKRKMRLRSSSLSKVQFQYGQDCTATVEFGQEDLMQVKLDAANPHNRIAKYLSEVLNEQTPFTLPGPQQTGLDRFCSTLMLTRPILTTLTELENATPGNLQNPAVYAHHVGNYRLTYANPLCSFDVQLRQKDDKVYWHIEDNDKKQPDLKPAAERNVNYERLETLKSALSGLFRQQGTRWFGLRTGILAEVDGIPDALKTLHQTVMGCAVEAGKPTFQDKTPATTSNANAGQPAPLSNKSGPNLPGSNAPPNATNTNARPTAPNTNARPNAPNTTNRPNMPNNSNRPNAPNARANPNHPNQPNGRLNFPNIGRQMNVQKPEVIELD